MGSTKPVPNLITYGLGEGFGALELYADGTAAIHLMTEREDTHIPISRELLPEFKQLVSHLQRGGFEPAT